VLVNNAGVSPESPAAEVPEEDFDYMVRVDLKRTFFASQAVGRLMIEQRYGRIISMSSQAGVVALPGEPIYCMTTAAITT
jgi:NAD(P)-dependent dehydrogenase (short-subunit alcohol dehydrogenase family)